MLFPSFGRYRKGFTLIELLVVISIISMLSSIMLASFRTVRQKAQMSAHQQNLRSLVQAIKIYKINHGEYPYFLGPYADGIDIFMGELNPLLISEGLISKPFPPETLEYYVVSCADHPTTPCEGWEIDTNGIYLSQYGNMCNGGGGKDALAAITFRTPDNVLYPGYRHWPPIGPYVNYLCFYE